MLRIAQRSALWSGNPKALNVAMVKMPAAEEFCTREPHFEGEEVFGSQKHKADIPLGSEYESHELDRVNFFHPQFRTRSTAAAVINCSLNDIPEEPSTDLQEHPIPNVNSKTTHVTAIHETTWKETEGTLLGCRRLQLRLVLPNKPLRRRTARRRSCKATRPRKPPHILVSCTNTSCKDDIMLNR
jgi:hypothetical protein